VVGGVQQHRDLLGGQHPHFVVRPWRWDGVGGGVVGDQPPGDRLGQSAVQAAVHRATVRARRLLRMWVSQRSRYWFTVSLAGSRVSPWARRASASARAASAWVQVG